MSIFKSRFTPNLENGEGVKFNKGEKVVYKTKDGLLIEAIIDSDYCRHNSGVYGYEAIFSDDGERSFAISKQIVDWKGKGRVK